MAEIETRFVHEQVFTANGAAACAGIVHAILVLREQGRARIARHPGREPRPCGVERGGGQVAREIGTVAAEQPLGTGIGPRLRAQQRRDRCPVLVGPPIAQFAHQPRQEPLLNGQ